MAGLYAGQTVKYEAQMTENVILISLAILPVIVLAIFIYRKDKFEKEPLRMLAKAFFFGCLSVIPAILIERALAFAFFLMGGEYMSGFVTGIYNGFIVAGCSEELCKLALLALAVWKAPDFNEYFDGIVYATFVALGFAGIENIMYVLSQSTFESAIMTGGVRAILSVPGHFLFAVVMGYYFALAKFNPSERRQNLWKAFVYPMLLHGTFDALLMIPEAMGEGGAWLSAVLFPVFIFFDIKMWKVAMRRLKSLQEMSGQQYSGGSDNGGDYGQEPPQQGDAFSGFQWDV